MKAWIVQWATHQAVVIGYDSREEVIAACTREANRRPLAGLGDIGKVEEVDEITQPTIMFL